MRRHLLFLLLIVVINTQAQSWKKTNAGIKATINKLDVEIQFYTASTVRIIKSPEGSSFDKKSLSVISTPGKINLSTKQQANILEVRSESVSVQCNLTTGSINFYTTSGTALLQEKENS